MTDDDVRLWHVTVTVAGAPPGSLILRRAVPRPNEPPPFLGTLRVGSDRAEVSYWDEADTLVDAASLGLRLWNEYRESANLPSWEVVGLEVVERDVRAEREQYDAWVDLHVAPQPF